ncbi:MAG TPA: RNA-binding domain-containing protein [Thermoplasmata archaeon]
MAVNPFSDLHARAFSHETEDIGKVRLAIMNVLATSDLKETSSEGIHGHVIWVLEGTLNDAHAIDLFFCRLSREDLEEIARTLTKRIDDGCNLFLRLDKQDAFRGVVRLADRDDVISVRVRVRSYPARCTLAADLAKQYLTGLLSASGE